MNVSLKDLPNHNKSILEQINKLINDTKKVKHSNYQEGIDWLNELKVVVLKSNEFSMDFIQKYNQLIEQIDSLSLNTSFTF